METKIYFIMSLKDELAKSFENKILNKYVKGL